MITEEQMRARSRIDALRRLIAETRSSIKAAQADGAKGELQRLGAVLKRRSLDLQQAEADFIAAGGRL